jgi:hypothetical protein
MNTFWRSCERVSRRPEKGGGLPRRQAAGGMSDTRIDIINGPKCLARYRLFQAAELDQVLPLLQLHDVQWSYDYRLSPQKALCIFLGRLSWPLRLHDVMHWFGCSRSQLSTLFNDAVIFLFQRFRNKLFFDRRRLTQRRMEWFVRAIER